MSAPTKFWATWVRTFRSTPVEINIENESVSISTEKRVLRVPNSSLKPVALEGEHIIRLQSSQGSYKLRFGSVGSCHAFFVALNCVTFRDRIGPRASYKAFKQSKTRGPEGCPTRVATTLSVSPAGLTRLEESSEKVTHFYSILQISRIQAMVHENDCFILHRNGCPPQLYWCEDRSALLAEITAAAQAAKLQLSIEFCQSPVDYTDYMKTHGMEVGIGLSVQPPLPCLVGLSVLVPVSKRHHWTALGGEGIGEAKVDEGVPSQPSLRPSDSRFLALSEGYIMEMTSAANRLLFFRPLTDVECVTAGDQLEITFRSDGLVKSYSFFGCVGYVPQADGSFRFLPEPGTSVVLGSTLSALALQDFLLSHVVASASTLGSVVDVLPAALPAELFYNGTRGTMDVTLHRSLLKNLLSCAQFHSKQPTPASELIQSKEMWNCLSVVVANTAFYRPFLHVKGTVTLALQLLCSAAEAVVKAPATVTASQPLAVMLMCVAVIRRLNRCKPGFDEATLPPSITALNGLLRACLTLEASPLADVLLLHRTRFICASVMSCVTVLAGPSKRNPSHGAAVVDITTSAVKLPRYQFSKHEMKNRRIIFGAGGGFDWVLAQLQQVLKGSDGKLGCRGYLAQQPSSLSCWSTMQLLDAVLVTQSESTSSELTFQLLEAMLVKSSPSSPSDALLRLPPMISMLCELSVLPHRRTATHATSLLHSVLQQVDPAARRSLQLQARDEGLLLHQLWCVVTQSTARIPVHDSRSASFRLLETLVAGNVGLEHIVRRAFPAGLHPSPNYVVHFDEYGRVAGYQRVGETAEEQPSPLVAASPTQRLITTPSGGKVLLTRKTMPPARPRAPKSTPQGSVATVAEDSVLQFLEDSEDLAKPIQKWGAIWNQDTVKDLRTGITSEVCKFESTRYGGLASGSEVEVSLSGRRIVWNAPDFEIVYPSVDAEVMVGPYILRLVFPGDPTARQEMVKPDKPLSAAVTPEFLTQLMYRLLGDSNAAVRLACVRAMERVLATATTPPSPLHILGHMVHLVCVSNGVLPDHIESEEWIATSRLDVSAGALPTLVAADILGVDLQFELLKVWQACLTSPPNVRRWWLAGGVTAVVSILQRTLGHFAEKDGVGDDPDGMSILHSEDDDVMDDEHEGKVDTPAPPVAVRDRLASHRGVQLSPIAIESSYASKHRVNTANSWLFVPSQPEPEAIAQRCLDVLYQVALVAAGDEGVGGGSGGRVSNLSGQRSDKVYTPPARIFQTLASPRVVAVVALMLRAKSPSVVETALSLLETSLVWCRATSHSKIQLARTGLFELLVQARTDDWVRPARILKALHLTQEPAHQFDPAALQYLRARSVAHGAAVDIESAVDLHQTFPELSSSCVGHLLPEGLVFALSSLTSARFAEVFNTTVSISTPVLKWSPTMRRALIHAISEFVSANMRPLQLASSQTPAASPLVVDHSWLRGSVKTFRWPDANQPDVYGDGLMLQPWNGPTVLFPQLRKHPQCNGVFLAEFNKAKHALSLDIPKPTSFFSSLLNFLRSSVAECSLALKNSTLQVPDENDRITAQRVHSASIVRVALILRSVNAVFQRCCLHSPPAQGDAPEWASFFGRAKAFDCCPLLLSAGNVLLEGVVSLTADGAPGPGGFAIGRVAATILTCCQCSEENCISIALAGGVKLLGELLRFVRSFETYSPDPCLRHLDLAVISSPVTGGSPASSDADSDGKSIGDDDSELETSMESVASPVGAYVAISPGLSSASWSNVPLPFLRYLCAAARRLTRVSLHGRPALLQDVLRSLSLILSAAVSKENVSIVNMFVASPAHTPTESTPATPTDTMRIATLIPDLLHFCVPALMASSPASNPRVQFDGGSTLTRASVVGPYIDPSSAVVRSDGAATVALQSLSNLLLSKSNPILACILRNGGLWYLLYLVMSGSLNESTLVSTAALRTLRVLARFLRGALDSAGVSSLPDARITYADDATILLFVGAMQALQSATPSRVLSVLLDTTTSEGEVFKVLGEEQLSLDGLWTHRIRRELYARSLQRVFGSESSGPNSAVESSHAAVVGDGDATGPTTWGKEEVGFMYDCLRE